MTRSQLCRYCPFWTQRILTALRRVYRLRGIHTYIASRIFPPIQCGMSQTPTPPPPCRHNVLVVSHEIMGPNRQTPLWGQTNPTPRSGSTLIPFVTTRSQPCRYCPLWTQRGPHGFKTHLQDTRSPYLYSAKNFPPIRCGMSHLVLFVAAILCHFYNALSHKQLQSHIIAN